MSSIMDVRQTEAVAILSRLRAARLQHRCCVAFEQACRAESDKLRTEAKLNEALGIFRAAGEPGTRIDPELWRIASGAAAATVSGYQRDAAASARAAAAKAEAADQWATAQRADTALNKRHAKMKGRLREAEEARRVDATIVRAQR
jgi:hypothetical protein